MPEPKLIGRQARGETPVELRSFAGRRQTLPADLLRQASRRLQIMALVGAGLWTLGVGIGHLAFHTMAPDDPRWARLNISDLIAVANVALGIALYFYLRKRDRDPASVVNLSLAYMVVTGLGLAIMLHFGIAPRNGIDVTPMITWIGPVTRPSSPPRPWGQLADGGEVDRPDQSHSRRGRNSRGSDSLAPPQRSRAGQPAAG